jgi:hypothetical protein
MKARDERSIARLDSAASELGLPTNSRVRLFLEDSPPMYEHYVAKLQSSVKRLRELKFELYVLTPQHAAEGTKTEFLRKRLRREYMIPLMRTGKPLLRFAPGVEKALKVPHARASHRELVTTAEVMLKTVQPYRKLLISEGFPKAFLTELRDLTKELKRIATTSSQRQAKFARVSGELREELARGNEALRILDGLVLARADRNPQFAKTWKDVLRTPKPLGRPRAKKRRATPNDESAHGSREKPLTT